MGDVPVPYGEQIRTGYTEDKELKASIIPSGRDARAGGGSYAFDANNPDIPQNIIVCEDGEMKKIAQVTRAQLSSGQPKPNNDLPLEETGGLPDPTVVEQRAVAAEKYYRGLAASENAPAAPAPQATMMSYKEPAVQATVMPYKEPATKPVYVTIKGPFGKIRQPFSKVFRDGMCLILKVDHATLPSSYELPELGEEEVMTLELQIDDHVVQCIHVGISFTEDSPSATFTVLLIQEETDIEEERLR